MIEYHHGPIRVRRKRLVRLKEPRRWYLSLGIRENALVVESDLGAAVAIAAGLAVMGMGSGRVEVLD